MIKEGFDLCCGIISSLMESVFMTFCICLSSDDIGIILPLIQVVIQESRPLGTWHFCRNLFCIRLKRVLKYDTMSLDAANNFQILNAGEIISAIKYYPFLQYDAGSCWNIFPGASEGLRNIANNPRLLTLNFTALRPTPQWSCYHKMWISENI